MNLFLWKFMYLTYPCRSHSPFDLLPLVFTYTRSPMLIRQCKQQQSGKKGKGIQVKQNQPSGDEFPSVPTCSCGAKRRFELELLPSILFALDVDGHAQATHGTEDDNAAAEESIENEVERKINNEFGDGGMDWGALAIYCCPASCDMSREEVVVVQKSVDGTPVKREFNIVQDDNSKNDEGQGGKNDDDE